MQFSNLDSPSMHFAVGMFCAGVLCIPVLLLRPRFWPFIPLVQGLGGAFALVPDYTIILGSYPRLFSSLPDMGAVRRTLHGDIGNLFFFHTAIDRSGEGSFLIGFALTVLQYNVWLCIFVAHYYLKRGAALAPSVRE